MATSAKLSILALVLATVFLSVAEANKCSEFRQGLTWEYVPGRDIFSLDIPSENECFLMCNYTPECTGYSWRFYGVLYWCYAFAELDHMHVCEDCFSGTMPTQFNGTCHTDAANVIEVSQEFTVNACHLLCSETDGCMGYTWYDETTSLEYYCFLYSECSEVKPSAGCSGGSMNCFPPLQ